MAPSLESCFVEITAGRVAADVAALVDCPALEVWDELLAGAAGVLVDGLFVLLLPHPAISSATATGVTTTRVLLCTGSSH